MLLDGKQEPTPAERASPDFQIPRVELAARPCDCAGVDQVGLEFPQRFLGSLSLVPPVGHVQTSELGSGPRAPPPPRREAALDPARKAGHRLHEMEDHDDEPQPDERPVSLPPARGELRPARADRGLCERQRNGDEQGRSEDDRDGHLRSKSASAFPYPTCCLQNLRKDRRRWCHTTAPGEYPMTPPRSRSRQHTSTSSPALRNLGSNPPIASSASFQNAMLHPGM